MSKPVLTEQDFIQTAAELDVEVAAIKAVSEVESRGAGFYPDGRPTILFERHVFSRLTSGQWDKSYPHLSNPVAGGYVSPKVDLYGEHKRFEEASRLHRDAAIQATSWGKFQLLGEGYLSYCRYPTLQAFLDDMYKSEQGQLNGFKNFIRTKRHVLPAMKAKDWDTFAFYYNGKNYRKNEYQIKLAAAYKRYNK